MGVGVKVRVKPEVEELVRIVAEKLGYAEYTVRNAAILLGLQALASLEKLPESDEDFLALLEKTKQVVLGGEEEEG